MEKEEIKMKASEVIGKLANEGVVERLAEKVCRRPAGQLSDLCQMVYLILLEYDSEKIVELYERRQINFFIVRILKNQFFGKTSSYHYAYRHFSLKSEPLKNE